MLRFEPAHVEPIAALLRQLRPDWTEPYISDSLARARHQSNDLQRVAMAALRCADDPTIAKPDVIRMPGAHWSTSREPNPPRSPQCPVCLSPHGPDGVCLGRPSPTQDHGYWIQQARDAVRHNARDGHVTATETNSVADDQSPISAPASRESANMEAGREPAQ